MFTIRWCLPSFDQFYILSIIAMDGKRSQNMNLEGLLAGKFRCECVCVCMLLIMVGDSWICLWVEGKSQQRKKLNTHAGEKKQEPRRVGLTQGPERSGRRRNGGEGRLLQQEAHREWYGSVASRTAAALWLLTSLWSLNQGSFSGARGEGSLKSIDGLCGIGTEFKQHARASSSKTSADETE